jgi:hypothetical protein
LDIQINHKEAKKCQQKSGKFRLVRFWTHVGTRRWRWRFVWNAKPMVGQQYHQALQLEPMRPLKCAMEIKNDMAEKECFRQLITSTMRLPGA